ncbi:MAG: radical SAM protein [Candidatus Aminicenantes bacterium]
MLDLFKREITYLRISVTDRCNLRCQYCMPAHGVKLKPQEEILTFEQITEICRVASKMGIWKVRLTGGEPLVRKNITHLVHMISEINGIKELCLSTNGVLLAPLAEKLKKAGLSRVNVSLDTLDAQKYKQLTRGGDIQKVFSGIEAVKKAGFSNTKINMVLIPGFNTDEIGPMFDFCRTNGLILQRINHYSLDSSLKKEYYYEAERPPDCKKCNRIRLTADGMLKPCLFSEQEIPVDFNDIESSISLAVQSKPAWGQNGTKRGNWEIGG